MGGMRVARFASVNRSVALHTRLDEEQSTRDMCRLRERRGRRHTVDIWGQQQSLEFWRVLEAGMR
jgi:hypothetical protein